MSAARWTSAHLDAWLQNPEGQDPVRIKKRKAKKAAGIDMFPLACVKYGLPEPVAEYRFDAKRRWRIDYYFEHNGRRVGVEVEGGVWTNGRHTRGKGFVADMEKYNAAQSVGIAIIRVTPGNLLKSETFDLIKKTLYA